MCDSGSASQWSRKWQCLAADRGGQQPVPGPSLLDLLMHSLVLTRSRSQVAANGKVYIEKGGLQIVAGGVTVAGGGLTVTDGGLLVSGDIRTVGTISITSQTSPTADTLDVYGSGTFSDSVIQARLTSGTTNLLSLLEGTNILFQVCVLHYTRLDLELPTFLYRCFTMALLPLPKAA